MSRFFRRAVPPAFALALVLLILTTSIALPIYCRPFYYAHIHALDLERSGFTEAQIRTAYDQVLDYLTLPGREFGTGELAHSAEGAAHFADCKVLFDLNAGVLAASALCVATILVLRRLGKVGSLRRAAFGAGSAAIMLPLVLGGLMALDFEHAFIIFHHIFFPGKDNWLFDPRTDQIIRVLPQEFFRNCAILIGCGLLVFSIVIMVLCRKNSRAR